MVTSRMSAASTVAPEQVPDVGEDLDVEARHPAQLAQLGDQVGAGARHRDEEGVGVRLRRDLHQPGAVTQDRDAHDAQLALGGVVVEEGDRQVGALRVAEQGGDDLAGSIAGPEHQQPVAALARRAPPALHGEPPAVAQAGHLHQGRDPADERDAEGDEPGIEHGAEAHQEDRR